MEKLQNGCMKAVAIALVAAAISIVFVATVMVIQLGTKLTCELMR